MYPTKMMGFMLYSILLLNNNNKNFVKKGYVPFLQDGVGRRLLSIANS